MVRHYDLLVIGAGPAGTAAALRATRAGMSVLILDKCSFPRQKACGGFISAKALQLLDADILSLLKGTSIHQIRYLSLRNDPVAYTSKNKRLGVVVTRQDFDYLHLQQAIKAGAEFHSQEWPLGITVGAYSVVSTNKATYHAKVVIGADGVFSSTAKLIGLRTKIPKTHLGFAITANVQAKVLSGSRGTMELYNIVFPWGLGWCFPTQDGYNIGVGASAVFQRLIPKYLSSFVTRVMDYKLIQDFEVRETKASYLPNGKAFSNYDLSKRNVLLIGDAAGLVEPFSGEGMYYALRSAQMVVDAIQNTTLQQLPTMYQQEFFNPFQQSYKSTSRMGWKGLLHRNIRTNPKRLQAFADFMFDANEVITRRKVSKANKQ